MPGGQRLERAEQEQLEDCARLPDVPSEQRGRAASVQTGADRLRTAQEAPGGLRAQTHREEGQQPLPTRHQSSQGQINPNIQLTF